ncbi:MAG: NAD(P)H-dependent oxidoreductase [Microbacteriaceae bacterium]
MHTLIVFDHPYGASAHANVPHNRSLSAALLAETRAGLADAGHSSDLIDLAADGFSPVMTKDDLHAWRHDTATNPKVLDYQSRLAAADHLVFIFPTWWMSAPAATKGFLDRVLTPGFAFEEPRPGGALVRTLHKLRGVTVITPMTTPAPLYSLWFCAPGNRMLLRGTFALIGIRNLRWVNVGRSAARGAASRARVLSQTRRRFASLRD